jgi:Fe-Mn family superoxide dismutase
VQNFSSLNPIFLANYCMLTLPTLNYGYQELEPYIDALTMEIHHTKHHQAYIDKANAILEQLPELKTQAPEVILRQIETIPESVRQSLINNLGGHVNHQLFWQVITPGGSNVSEYLTNILSKAFGSLEIFVNKFTETAMSRFGSGWAWLVINPDKSLEILSTPNQDSPLMQNKQPILGLDVWEHAYYLKYQNRRLDYIQNWWHVVNWVQVEVWYKQYSQ